MGAVIESMDQGRLTKNWEGAARSQENLAEVLEALAALQAAAPLLHLPGRPALTYADLGEQIGHVRERLRGWGIVQGDIVAGAIESRPYMALACAALPSSSTFAPLSPWLTEGGYAALLERLRPRAVVVEEARDHPLRAAAKRLGIAEIRIVPDSAAAFGRFRLVRAASDDLGGADAYARAHIAYALVTSGTTGRSKVVPLGHRQMLAYAQTMVDWLRLEPGDIGCSLSPLHLAGGLRGTFLIPVLSGGSVVCLAEGDTDGFFRAISEFQLTYFGAGFAVHRAILRRAAHFQGAVAHHRLRFLRTTAGRLEPDEIDRLETIFDAPVVVGLGSTEVCGIAHDPLPPRPRKRGAVGIPTANEIAVVDASGRLCARDSVGEILVRGPLVFDGYLDDPDLTARSFVGNWFRTGDLGRIDEDGYVFLCGRITEMINRGGEKISPAEIDGALESLAGVAEAAAFGIPHAGLGEELVAAVVRDAGATITESDVIDHVRVRMGTRQVPRRVYFVDRLPRTESGKVQRSVLAQTFDHDSARGEDDQPAVAVAVSPLEAALASLWSTTLHGRTVGRDDDFFLSGGDSLSGMHLLACVKAAFDVELPIKALLDEAATIANMGQAIERRLAAVPRPPSGLLDAPTAFAEDASISAGRGR